jgi:prephenate dehydrogenase
MRLGIIGTGLIGASIGLAARPHAQTILGHDAFAFAASLALDRGAIDEVVTRDEIYERCDLVVVATHVNATIEEVAALSTRSLRDDRLVIDVASVKAPIVRAAAGNAAFVATHPMAGSERSGPIAASAELFTDRTWCYIPGLDPARTERARSFIALLGATPVAIPDAEEHDEIVALTSHVPQLIAYAFTERIEAARRQFDPAVLDALCGPAARELLRLGRSPSQMWNDIFAVNGERVARESVALQRIIDDHRLPG